jgi:hypothetical protein
MHVVSIPRAWMGQTMQEAPVKAGLRSLNPDLHFDMGACLNIWHPYKDSRQNVYYLGRSVGAMDRGTLPEVPVWTTRRDLVEVHWTEVKANEIALYNSAGVKAKCLKCFHVVALGYRPAGLFICPALCGNMGQAADATLFEWANVMGETAHVFRKVKDRVILVGWRHTFSRLCRAGIPGITKETLETQFGVNLDPRVVDDIQIDEDLEGKMLDRRIAVA